MHFMVRRPALRAESVSGACPGLFSLGDINDCALV